MCVIDADRFSANLGFLWKDQPFLKRIQSAAASGFDALEFHDDAQTCDIAALREVVAQAKLPVVCLNVHMGATAGCAAIAGMGDDARRDVDAAIAAADRVGAGAIHVLAGKTIDPDHGQYLEVLRYALAASDLTILIEPISAIAMPGYHLNSLDLALRVIDDVGDGRLKILFDCFHVEMMHGDLIDQFRLAARAVGHVQISSVPERSEPWPSRIDYAEAIPKFREYGYEGAFGCEYIPSSTVEAGLGWRDELVQALGRCVPRSS